MHKKNITLPFVCIVHSWLILLLIIALANVNTVFAKDIFPALIIVYDDGYIQDLTKALPVHQKMDAPAVSSVNPNSIGNKGKMSKEDLHLLLINGWEIANHGHYHSFLGHNQIKNEIKRYTNSIEIENIHFVEERYDYLLCDGQKRQMEKIEVDAKIIEKNNTHIKTKEPILGNYSDKSYLVMTRESMRQEIVRSRKKLLKMGFRITSFMYPYNGYTEQAEDIVQKHYQFARGGMREGKDFPEAFINTRPLNCSELKGTCFENDMINDKDLKKLLNNTEQRQGLLILYAHTDKASFTKDRLQFILRTAQDLRLNIITFQDLMDSFKQNDRDFRRFSGPPAPARRFEQREWPPPYPESQDEPGKGSS